MSFLKKIYSFVYKLIIQITWILDSIICRLSIKDKKRILKIKEYNKILIIVPHADDEWIGCSQILSYSKNVELCFLNFTGSNNNSKNKNIRCSELQKLCSAINVKLNILTIDYEEELISFIRELKPELICVPYFLDWHSEHRKSCVILKEAIMKLSDSEYLSNIKICSYQISVPIPSKLITEVSPLKIGCIIKKWKIFNRYYISQKNIPVLRFICYEFISGAYGNYMFSDVFYIEDYKKWISFIDNNLYIDSDYYDLKENINKIKKMFKISNSKYK